MIKNCSPKHLKRSTGSRSETSLRTPARSHRNRRQESPPTTSGPLGSRIDDLNAAAAAVELDKAVDQGVERVVAALANPLAGVKPIAHLADDNVPGSHLFAAES